MESIYDFKALTNKGQELNFSELKGKTLLIVNTASKCGLTPQFEGLEQLNKKYKEQGLIVIGFPCNQFAHQEPGDSRQASKFCQLNYGVSFLMMKKIDVNGKNAAPIFQYLKKQAGGFITNAIKWNFTKFLVSSDGTKIKRYSPLTKPKKLEKDIETFLSKL